MTRFYDSVHRRLITIGVFAFRAPGALDYISHDARGLRLSARTTRRVREAQLA